MNGRTTIQDLSELIGRLNRTKAEYQGKIAAMERQIEAVQTTLSLYRQELGLPDLPKIETPFVQTTDMGLDARRRVMLLSIASQSKGKLVMREVGTVLAQAGLFRDKRQFRNHIYRLMERMGGWEPVKRGVYRLTPPELKPDYWRCPDGRLHDWNYIRRPDGTGIYICKNCPMRTDKATLKAKTDGGPPPVDGSSSAQAVPQSPTLKIQPAQSPLS